jgi:Domain of unknown function (DUF4920)
LTSVQPRALIPLLFVAMAACSEAPAPGRQAALKPAAVVPQASPAQASVAAPAPAGERSFGAPPGQVDGPLLAVAEVMREPEPYLGKKVRCEGVVARVCQRAGCWLELSPDGKSDGLRVPMAGHSFFIPQDAIGQHAVVEGELSALPLKDSQRAHLESEGLKAIGPLSLAATSVTLK